MSRFIDLQNIIQNAHFREKRVPGGLDFGVNRGFSGSKAARQLYGLAKVANAVGPGK